jgi:hypothetical protein
MSVPRLRGRVSPQTHPRGREKKKKNYLFLFILVVVAGLERDTIFGFWFSIPKLRGQSRKKKKVFLA